MMTIVVPHGSLRSQNSLANSNMSRRRRNVWPQHKIMQCAHLYGPETREVSASICELHNTVSDEERSRPRHRCSLGCKKDRMLITRASNSKQSGRATREGSARRGRRQHTNSVISHSNQNRQRCAAQHGPVVRTQPHLTIQ